MFSSLTLTLISLLPLLTTTAAQLRPVPVTLINSCTTTISPRFLGTNNGLANPADLAPGGRVSVTFDGGFAGAIFAGMGGNMGQDGATRAEFVMQYGYYYISLVRGFNVGISIDPLAPEDLLYPSGFCPIVTCATADCSPQSAARGGLTITPPEPPREGPAQPPPNPPLYSCVSSNGGGTDFPIGYTVTFCPSGTTPPPSTTTTVAPTTTAVSSNVPVPSTTSVTPPPPPPPTNNGNTVRLHPNGDNSKCLDLAGNLRYSGSPVQIYDCNGTPAQDWTIARGAGSVKLAGTDYCLDAGSYPGNGIGMKIWQCYNGLPQQNWYYTGDNRIAVTNQGQCLDMTDGNKSNGQRVQTWQCSTGNTNQIWTSN